jgi:uncharacterized membrane protein
MYQLVVYLHILAALGFISGHGASAGMAFQLPKERDTERIRAMLDVSASLFALTYGSLLLLLVAGVTAGFIGKWWGSGWIWLSLGILIVLIAYMAVSTRNHYNQVRKVVGQPYFDGSKEMPAEEPGTVEEIESAIASTNPRRDALLGYGAFAAIVFLMIYKPF